MLEEVLYSINNWFEASVTEGEFVIEGGSLSPLELLDGQYFRIVGSVLNDGLHTADDVLRDETFHGKVFLLAVPAAVVALADEIAAWSDGNGESAFQSESFGGYSYSKMADIDGSAMGWQGAFRTRLNRWRKL